MVRYPDRSGSAKAAGPAEVVIDNTPPKRHWTRDLAVSRDGKRLLLAVGSASNLGGSKPDMTPENIRRHEKTHGSGAAWGEEENRAVVRVFDPEGRKIHNYATGLRNCSGLAMQPGTDHLWCVLNERDHLGPLLAPDYMARVIDGGFYGWPWYYIGGNEDPALKGKRPDLKAHGNQCREPGRPHAKDHAQVAELARPQPTALQGPSDFFILLAMIGVMNGESLPLVTVLCNGHARI